MLVINGVNVVRLLGFMIILLPVAAGPLLSVVKLADGDPIEDPLFFPAFFWFWLCILAGLILAHERGEL